jgi:glucose/arabinose dehydrogenase
MVLGRPAAGPAAFKIELFACGLREGGRPVGVTVARDGALLVWEGGNGTIWCITRQWLAVESKRSSTIPDRP